MEITIEGLNAGKSTIIKDNKFFETKEYTNPFITELTKFTNKFIVNVQTPDQCTITGTSKDVTYNRVWVQAILPGETEYKETYNLVYALDTKTPVYKVFRAYKNPTSKNLYAFSNNWLITNEIKSNEKFEYDIKTLFGQMDNFEVNMRKLKSTFLSPEQKDIQTFLGNLIDKVLLLESTTINGKIKISPTDIIKSYIQVYNDSTSAYYINKTEECSLFNFYDSICSQITNSKDFINKFEKIMLINNLFEIC